MTWHLKAIACAPKLGRLVQEIGKERATAAVATAMELNPKVLRFAPWTAEYLAQMADPEAAQQSLKNVPGWEDVAADAPGADRLHAEFEKAAREGTFIAGRLLLMVASLVEHHREVDASLARAIAILVEAKRRKPFLPIPDPRHIKEVWKRWRCVVPLWAATIAASEHLADSTPGFSTAEGATEVLLMPAGRMAVLGMAAWFRDFAIRFKPLNSGKRLLPERECAGMPSRHRSPEASAEAAARLGGASRAQEGIGRALRLESPRTGTEGGDRWRACTTSDTASAPVALRDTWCVAPAHPAPHSMRRHHEPSLLHAGPPSTRDRRQPRGQYAGLHAGERQRRLRPVAQHALPARQGGPAANGRRSAAGRWSTPPASARCSARAPERRNPAR